MARPALIDGDGDQRENLVSCGHGEPGFALLWKGHVADERATDKI